MCVRERGKETDRQRDRDRQRGRSREIQRDKERYREREWKEEGERNGGSCDLMYLYTECKHLAVITVRCIYNSLLRLLLLTMQKKKKMNTLQKKYQSNHWPSLSLQGAGLGNPVALERWHLRQSTEGFLKTYHETDCITTEALPILTQPLLYTCMFFVCVVVIVFFFASL